MGIALCDPQAGTMVATSSAGVRMVDQVNTTAQLLEELAALLRDREARYRELVEGSIQGICIQQDRRICFANAAMAHMFGYACAEALIGRYYQPLIASHEQSRLEGYRRARLCGEPVPCRYEYQGLRQDGALIWIECLVSIVAWHGAPALLSTCLDITARKQAEDALGVRLQQLEAMRTVAMEMDAGMRALPPPVADYRACRRDDRGGLGRHGLPLGRGYPNAHATQLERCMGAGSKFLAG